ncbi:AraC family transcriptional regulator [Solicola gregarius]|uniref:AraC family transcriptional regulator n=1 Tax=Solicola gregarius TaxID=2908642 RepID=A0AA46TJF0_9ACTN|nr:AraC family transcriptional regulator [Solicola gregarius]UYM06421.1 AraC family transcriptional regulator [Solicola gregarius]
MDAISGLLDGPRARGAFVLRSTMQPPWSLRIQDEAPLSVIAAVRGDACIVRRDIVTWLNQGDVAVICGPEPYDVADKPSTAPQSIIQPGQVCTTPDGVEVPDMAFMGVRAWGNARDGRTVLLTGTYQLQSEISARLLSALPELVHLPADALDTPLIAYLAEETVKDEPGQEALLDRLLDLLLIAVLRAWFARPDAEAPGWYRAHGDPVVGPALQLLHNNPERQWTVESIASAAGVSRAALSRRFTALVGEPPMTFLTNWRLTLAADLLHEPGNTVESVARKVGYGSAFALSTAFKRVYGVSPREHRERAYAGG